MDRYDFLRTVLASEGNYVGHFGHGNRHWNIHYSTIEDLANGCVEYSNRGITAYYALGTFTDNLTPKDTGGFKVQRLAKMAHKFKTFAIDIDCGDGKPYTDAADGMRALLAFLKKTLLPPPMAVSSGNGIHAYWPLTDEITAEQWRIGGTALKAICAANDLKIDESKVCDPSMVLRPLDTINFKGGNTVRALTGTRHYAPESIIRAFIGLVPPATRAPKPIKVSAVQGLTSAILAAEATQYPPFIPDRVVEHCAQVSKATEFNGRDALEPVWYLAVGLAGFSNNPEQTAINWSCGHEGYDEVDTLNKMAQWKEKVSGPPTCERFDAVNPGVCKSCPHWGHVGSPATLGRPDPVVEAPAVQLPDGADVSNVVILQPDETSPAIDPPQPFRRGHFGVQFQRDGVWNDICSYDLFPSHIVRDPTLGYDAVEWIWKKPHVGYTRMRIRASYIFNDSSVVDLNTALANEGFFVETKTKQSWLGVYMRAYIQMLQKHQKSVELYDSFGWKDDFSKFVIGSTEYRREADGSVSAREVGVSKLIANKGMDKFFSAKGSDTLWTEWSKILDHPSLGIHQMELARAFAAPLVAFTGLKGFSISMLGESGAGKSTMQAWAASVYGRPDDVNMKADDTQLSVVQRLGIYSSLPLAIDEMSTTKPELIAQLLYWSTQGQDRNRANEAVALKWATAVSMSANYSLRDKVSVSYGNAEAIQMRILEFNVPKNPVFNDASNYGTRISAMINDNYGGVGRRYIQGLLALGPTKIKEEIELRMHYVERKYGVTFEGKERYWKLAIVLCDLGAHLAKKWGLIAYDYSKGTAAAIDQLNSQRVTVQSAQMDSFDAVSEYINQFGDCTLMITYTNDGKAMVQEATRPRGEIRIRKEFYKVALDSKVERGFAYIDKHHFQRWAVTKGFDFKSIIDTLNQLGAGFRPGKNGRIYLAKDSGMAYPQCAAFGINLSHERFAGMLEHHPTVEGNVIQFNKGAA